MKVRETGEHDMTTNSARIFLLLEGGGNKEANPEKNNENLDKIWLTLGTGVIKTPPGFSTL